MIAITGSGKSTIRRSIEELESRKLIEKAGKPFGGSCRYRVLSIVPPEGRMDSSNSSTTGTIEPAPIVPPQDRNSPSHGTSIVPPEGQEGYPSKGIQRRVSNKREKSPEREPSTEQIQFAIWFKSSLPKDQQDHLPKNWLKAWSEIHEKLVRIDKRTPEKIREVCQWARTDDFWQKQFRSPAKLRERDKQRTFYFDVFTAQMKAPMASSPNKTKASEIDLGGRKSEYL
jgi:hypothetical protein